MFKTNNYNIVDFEILSYNVRGIDSERKRKKLFNYIKKHTSSNTVVCLQETHSTKKDVLMWKYQWHGDIIFSHGSSNQKGVLVAFRYGLEYKMLSPEVVDNEGRFIILHIEIQGSPYVLINYYAPDIELNQVKKLQQIKSKLQNMSINENTQFILTGDWNLVFDRSLDALGGSPTLKFNSHKEIQSLMIDYELLDIWRARNPTLHQFTWRQKKSC